MCLFARVQICVTVCPSDCLSVSLSVCLCPTLFVCSPVFLSVCLFVSLSVCLSVYLSVPLTHQSVAQVELLFKTEAPSIFNATHTVSQLFQFYFIRFYLLSLIFLSFSLSFHFHFTFSKAHKIQKKLLLMAVLYLQLTVKTACVNGISQISILTGCWFAVSQCLSSRNLLSVQTERAYRPGMYVQCVCMYI